MDTGNEFFLFSLKIAKKSIRLIHNMNFSKHFKCKGTCLSNSLDSVLSFESRDVLTGSLAQSVQELWPIISSGVGFLYE